MNNQSRREFLGSTLGIFVGAQLPWIAKLPTSESILQSSYTLEDFRADLLLVNAEVISGLFLSTDGNGRHCVDISPSSQMHAYAISIFRKDKQIIDFLHGRLMPGPRLVEPGDTLRIFLEWWLLPGLN